MQVAADLVELDERRRLGAEGLLAQLGRAEGDAERAVDAFLVGRIGQRLERLDVLARAGRAQELRPEPPRLGDDELDRDALDRDARRPPLASLDDRDDLRKLLELLEQRLRIETEADDGKLLVHVAPAPRIAGDLAADPLSDSLQQGAGSVQQQAAPRARPLLPCERGDQLGLRLRPDPGHACEPSLCRGLPELLGGAHAESAPDLDRTLRAETDEPPEPDELGRDLALQLVELGDPPRLEELAEPRLDPRADAAQLADAAGLHELRDRRLRLADQLGGPPVGAHGVGARFGEVEQGCERLQAVRDLARSMCCSAEPRQ